MRPDFGCRIWDMIMEPMTPFLRQQMIDEAARVAAADPRVEVEGINAFDFQNGIRIEVTGLFVGRDVAETFFVDFEREESDRTALTVDF
jgi:phage baseplate assembly protein W